MKKIKKIALITGIFLAIPLTFTLLLKTLHLLQGVVSGVLSLLLWCLSVVAALLLVHRVLTGGNSRQENPSVSRR